MELQQDISREWLTREKVAHLLRVLFSAKATKVLDWSPSFREIHFDTLFEHGKRGMILDVDECIAPHHWDVTKENLSLIRILLQSGWKIVIFSNMKKSDRYRELEDLWIKVVTSSYAKPDARGFEECIGTLAMDKWEIIMVWDNFLTDGWAIGVWIDFIKVDPIRTNNDKVSVSRMVQKSFRWIVDMIARKRNSIK